ncbi:MAG: hypothetical protein ABR587_04410 [Candidatus Binatia bacterium]
MRIRSTAAALSMLFLMPAGIAAADTLVPGSSNPNLAGRAAAYTCCSGDSAPLQSPPLMTDVEFTSCDALNFSASGKVSFSSATPVGNNPDGDATFNMTNFGDGLSGPLSVRANALLGVFLDDDSPTGTPTPARLSFASGLGFSSLSPGIGQIFFIGDGLTSDTKAGLFDGTSQIFVVPPGATRLFFGTGDGSGWYNNKGSFVVETSNMPVDYLCGDAVGPSGVTASDALHVLRAAVGSAQCLLCLCDADGSGKIAAGDALAVLRYGVGHDVPLRCPCCATTTTTTTTTTSTTSTTTTTTTTTSTTTTTMPACIGSGEACTVDGTPCCSFLFCATVGLGKQCVPIPGIRQ